MSEVTKQLVAGPVRQIYVGAAPAAGADPRIVADRGIVEARAEAIARGHVNLSAGSITPTPRNNFDHQVDLMGDNGRVQRLPLNQEAINHMTPEQLVRAKKAIDTKLRIVTSEITSQHEIYNSRSRQRDLYADLTKTTVNAGAGGFKANEDTQRAAYQQAASLAQANQKVADELINNNRGKGQDFSDQATRLMDEVQALVSSNNRN